jgi:thioredoxin 1
MVAPVAVTDASFRHDVLESELPVLVDFWAGWCGPGKTIAPIVKDFASEYQGRLKVTKADYDARPTILSMFRVMSILTLMVSRGGQPSGTVVGYQPKAALRAKLDALLRPSP